MSYKPSDTLLEAVWYVSTCVPIKQCRSKSYVSSTIVSYRMYFYQVTALSYQVVYINLALRSTTVVLMHQWKLYYVACLVFHNKIDSAIINEDHNEFFERQSTLS